MRPTVTVAFHRCWIGLILVTFVLVGCDQGVNVTPVGALTPFADLGQFSKNAVTVSAQLVEDESGQLFVQARFTPDEPNWHLYSKDLPLGGIEGAGRPTLIHVQSPAVETLGEPFADIEPYEIEFVGFEAPFSIYPDGPVQLSLPIRLNGDQELPSTLDLSITYMACSSDGVCKPPVENFQFSSQISLLSGD